MKILALLFISILSLPLFGDMLFTVPEGFTKVTIAAAESVATPKLTAISTSLLRDLDHSGPVSLGTYTVVEDPAPNSQTLNVSGVTWTANQWTPAGPQSSPYLAYLAIADDPGNADGINPAEEAFLITGNTADGELTVECSFDLATRFPTTTTVKIRKANTLDSFFGNLSTNFGGNDVVYLWGGSAWDSFQFVGGQWTSLDDPFTDIGATTLIYPDEGVFISRAETTPIIVSLLGEVPAAPQISTIAGAYFLGSRFPVDTTLIDLGVANEDWTGNDILYLWNPVNSPSPTWNSFQFVGGQWATVDDPFTSADHTIIPANSAVFVSREIAVPGERGGIISTLPYPIGE